MSTTHSVLPTLRLLRREAGIRGIAPWDTIKDLSAEQLQQMLVFAAKEPSFTPDDLAARALGKAVKKGNPLLAKMAAAWMVDAPTGTSACAFIDALQDDEVLGVWYDLVHATNVRLVSSRVRAIEGLLAHVANRRQYLHQIVLNTIAVTPDGIKDRKAVKIRYAQMHSAYGLIDHLCDLFGTRMEEPAYVRFFPNATEQWDPASKKAFFGPIDPGYNFSKMLFKEGWLLSKDKLAWRANSRVLKILSTFFETWLDAASYGHRLTTPLVPDGFIRNVPAIFKVTADLDGSLMGTDGSGFYNPEHPMWQQLVERWGRVVMQMTFVNGKEGHFIKGILYPREDIDPQYACSFDPNQVKGRLKGKVGEGDTVIGTLGVMRAFSEMGTMGANFEIGMQLMSYAKIAQIYGAAEVSVAREWAERLVGYQMNDLARGGVDKILHSLGNDNPEIAAILNLAKISRSHGQTVNLLSYPAVHKAVMRRLSERLREIGDGFGIRGQQNVLIMDNNISQGNVVVSGVKAGTKVAIFRYPCILPQGVLIREAMDPLPHHIVEGKLPPCVALMTPQDAALCQGDDDGDIVAVVTSPDQVAFLDRYLDKPEVPLLIEPIGVKFTEKLVENGKPTALAIEKLAKDQRGAVGLATILQAEAAFAGDRDVADVLAAAVQYAVDAAKKQVRGFYMDDMLQAMGWQLQNGFLKIAPEAMRDEPVEPEELVEWSKKLTQQRGRGYTYVDKSNQVQWRGWNYLYGRKQAELPPNEWLTRQEFFEETCQRSGPPAWLGADSYDQMVNIFRNQWEMWEEQLAGAKESPKDMAEAILMVAKVKGVQLNCLAADWATYLPLRDKSGITSYQKSFADVMAKANDPKARNGTVELLRERLAGTLGGLSLDELFTIVVRESTPTWSKEQYKAAPVYFATNPGGKTWTVNRPNFGLTVLSSSKLAMVLGLQKEACPFQEENWVLSGINKDGNAYHSTLGKVIHMYPSKLQGLMDHQKHFALTGKHFWQCSACMQKLEDELVALQRIAEDKGDKWAKDLVRGLNAQYTVNPHYINVPPSEAELEEEFEQDFSYE